MKRFLRVAGIGGIVLAALFMLVRFGTCHLSVVGHSMLVSRPGAPFLHPLLGTDEIDVQILDEYDQPKELTDWAREHPWRLRGAFGLPAALEMDAALRQRLADWTRTQANMYIAFAIALPEIRADVAAHIESGLLSEAKISARTSCVASVLGPQALKLRQLRADNSKLIATFKQVTHSQSLGTPEFGNAVEVISGLSDARDPEIDERVSTQLASVQSGPQLLKMFAEMPPNMHVSPSAQAHVATLLLGMLEAHPSINMVRCSRHFAANPAKLIEALNKLRGENPSNVMRHLLVLDDPQIWPAAIALLQRGEATREALDLLLLMADIPSVSKSPAIQESLRRIIPTYFEKQLSGAESSLILLAQHSGMSTAETFDKLVANKFLNSRDLAQILAINAHRQPPFFDAQLPLAAVQKLVESRIKTEGPEGCEWAAVALDYGIANSEIAENFTDPDCGHHTELKWANAQRVLLPSLQGTPEQSLQQLIKIMRSKDAERSLIHRRSLTKTLELLLQREPAQRRGEMRKEFAEQLEKILAASRMPIHQRIEIAEMLALVREPSPKPDDLKPSTVEDNGDRLLDRWSCNDLKL